jgi:hypothetical protein
VSVTRVGMTLVLALTCLLAVACGDSDNHYARYQDKKGAIEKIEALVATIPQYPGAHRTMSQWFGTSYKLSYDRYIQAEPYWSALYYDLSQAVTGATLQRYFRRVMHARGWSCRFHRRSPGVPYGFGCVRRGAVVGGYIADHGHYELDVSTNQPRPPIKTVPGD